MNLNWLWKANPRNRNPLLHQIREVKVLIEEAFDYKVEMAGCIRPDLREEFLEKTEIDRKRVLEFIDSLFQRREGEAAGHYKVVSAQNGHGLAFTIMDERFFVYDRFKRQTWASSGRKLYRTVNPPKPDGWVTFDKAPPELIEMWNARHSSVR